MTSLVLGVAIGAVGQFFGIPFSVGFAVGSLIGSLIDPPKVEGPRLGDLKLQVSTYGKMIPYVWGTGRIAGNIIDQTDLQEHKQKDGGKGGPEVTSYTYSASIDVLICECPYRPILGIRRIWADGRLIWSDTTGEDMPCTLYKGDADQEPDPTFEAIHGVGNVPGYNGFAHVVFADYFLTDFGNRIPQFEFEIYTNVGTFPWRVSNFTTLPTASTFSPKRTHSYANGIITIGAYCGDGRYYEEQFDLDGNPIPDTAYDAALVGGAGGALSGIDGITGGSNGLFGTGWYYKENFVAALFGNTYANNGQLAYYNGFIFSTGTGAGNVGLSKWPAPNGVIDAATGLPEAEILLEASGTASNWILGRTNRDNVYVWHNAAEILYEYDFDLTAVIRQWDLSALNAAQAIINGKGFTIYENHDGDLILACDRGQAGFKNAGAFYLNDDLTSTFIGQVDAIGLAIGDVALLGSSGYALIADGVISLIPPPAPELLSTIVDDISNLNGSTVPHDVTELTDEVRWFAIASQMTKRNAIQVLRPAFFFDAVESDDVVVFKKRGGSPVFSIPDDSLCGRGYGDESGDPLRTIRTKEQGLPRTVTMTYYDVDMDYQVGAQSSPRQVTLSEQDVSLDIPVGFTASEALQKSWAIQCAEWIRRERFEWKTIRNAPVHDLLHGNIIPACQLEPCDVGFVRGREIYIETRNEAPNGVITWTGVLNAPSIYTQTAQSGVGGFVPQGTPGENVATELVLLDIPILSQADSPFGFYAAMGPSRDGKWPGATLFKSLDGGTTWIAVASTGTAAVIAHTAEPPGSPTVSAVLAPYFGGDVVDESELGLRLTDDDAELESITALALTNGANLSALSRGLQGSPATLKWELLQFRDATLVATKSEVTQGFLRGRKDTATSSHAAGDTFVLLTTVVNVDAPESELGLSLKYKAVTFGTALADAPIQDFINTGLSADEFFGTEIEHLPPFTGDNGSPGGGSQGLVPAPGPGDCAAGKFLSACGDWQVPSGSGGSPSGSGIETQDDGVLVEPSAQILNAVTPLSAAIVGGATDLTHDVSGATPGSYGDGFNIPVLDVDSFGHVTSASSIPVGSATPATGGDVWRTLLIRYLVPGNSTTPQQFGFAFGAAGAIGTAASSSYLESRRYLRVDTSALVNSSPAYNANQISFWQGNAAGLGGYRIQFDFGMQASSTELRSAVGLFGTISNVTLVGEPVNLTNAIFVGCDQSDTELQIFHNDGAGTCTKSSLGANFPKTVGACYRLTLTQVPNTASVDWRVDRLDSSFTDTGTISSNMPANTTFLNPELCISTGSTLTTALRLAVFKVYSEQPF